MTSIEPLLASSRDRLFPLGSLGVEALLRFPQPGPAALTAMVSTVVPVAPAKDGTPYSGSSADAYGAVLLSEPPDSTAFAVRRCLIIRSCGAGLAA